jgi:hypothetical protein
MIAATKRVLLGALLSLSCSCRSSVPDAAPPVPPVGPALPLDRIAIVGASVSVGFGGTPFGDAFAAAAPRSKVESYANLYLFRDPIGESQLQADKAIAYAPTAVVALDFLFWDLYGSPDADWRQQALASALANLERIRANDAWIVLGDIPYITTAAEWMLPKERVPAPAKVTEFNAEIAAWASGRDRVLLIPFASWSAPLVGNSDVELAPGERVQARSLLSIDGLHANPLGVWYLLDKLDHFIEKQLPGTPPGALVFTRPK